MSASPDPRRSARLRRRPGTRPPRMSASPLATRPRRRAPAPRFSLYGDSYVAESDASASVDGGPRRGDGPEKEKEEVWLTPGKALAETEGGNAGEGEVEGDEGTTSRLVGVRESLFNLLGEGREAQVDDDDDDDGDIVVASDGEGEATDADDDEEDNAGPDVASPDFALAPAYDDPDFDASLRAAQASVGQIAREIAGVIRHPPRAVRKLFPVLLVLLFAIAAVAALRVAGGRVDFGGGRTVVGRIIGDAKRARARLPGLQMPGLPGLPGLPGMPVMPGMPGLPSMPSLPSLPVLPSFPSVPDFSGTLDTVNPMPAVFKALSKTVRLVNDCGLALLNSVISVVVVARGAVQSVLAIAAGFFQHRPAAISLPASYAPAVADMIETYAADKGAPPDFALASVGGKVLTSSPSAARLYIRFLANYMLSLAPTTSVGYSPSLPNLPAVALNPDVSPGNCWAFPGDSGSITVRLARPIRADSVTIEHTPRTSVFSVSSAPRDVAVFVQPLAENGSAPAAEFVHVGKFVYDASTGSRHLQAFALDGGASDIIARAVRFDILSNHGSATHTCLYRVRVHGEPTSAADAEAATERQML